MGYKCKCREGYVGNGIGDQGCTKPAINECASIKNPCGRNSQCTDLKMGYECNCIKVLAHKFDNQFKLCANFIWDLKITF